MLYKPNELMLYFEEYLNFKGINKPFNFSKTYMELKGTLNEIQSGYIALFVVLTIFGFAYSYFQKYSDNKNDNIKGIDIMNIDKAKFTLRNGKKLTIIYGIFDNRNEALHIVSILGIILIIFLQTLMFIIPHQQMIYRECNIEIDDSSDHPEHELMTQNNKFHNKVIVRCMNCM